MEQEEELEDLVDDHDDVTDPYDPNTYRLTPLLYSPPQKRRDDHEAKGIKLFNILPKLNPYKIFKKNYIPMFKNDFRCLNILEFYIFF